MYTDTCEIVTVTRDVQFGTITKGVATPSPCRVENTDILKEGSNGNKVHYSRLYFLPASCIIKKGDHIRAILVRGVPVAEDFSEAEEAFPIGGIYPHHIEVQVK